MEKLLIGEWIRRIDILAAFDPLEIVCEKFYKKLKENSNDNMELVTEALREYQTHDANEDAIKAGLLYYMDRFNKEVG